MLVTSASQDATFTDCNRKWWLEKVARMPSVPKGYLIFGTVLHACLERWASADSGGRVPTTKFVDVDPEGFTVPDGPLKGQRPGAPAEVFPPGWETVEERGAKASVTPNEAALIRRLVEQAVERGIVQRGDGRVLEREIRLPVIEGVELLGFIDVFLPGQPGLDYGFAPQIHDHKTFGESSVRFLKQESPTSPNYLGKDKQLLTYAAATSILDGWTGGVVLRHNQFPKFADSKGPRWVEAFVTAAECDARWEEIKATAAKMLRVRDIKKWDDVPGPVEADTCQKYGGCPFRDICGRRSTLEGYKGRVERQLAEAKGPRPDVALTPRKGPPKNMTQDLFANARRRGSVPQANPADVRAVMPNTASAPAPIQPAAPAVGINGGAPAPAAPPPPAGAPPWANPNCTACKGVGFNSKGRPCPICDALAKRLKRPTSSLYMVEGDMQAGFTAAARAEHAEALAGMGAPAAWSSKGGASAPAQPSSTATAQVAQTSAPAQAENIAAVAVQPTPERAAEKVAEIAASDAAAEARGEVQRNTVLVDEPAAKAETRGRKPVGLSIFIGCVPLKGPARPTETAQGLLQRLGAELAKDMGAGSYWELDAFKRRDRIKQRSAEIAEGLGKTMLLVAGVRDPDVDSLVAALLPHAETIVEGLR